MSNEKINDKYKDALFRIIFGEHPENALSLYNAINGSEYTNVEDLEITTLKDAVYVSIKNDVSFLFNHEMSLYEHQSTFSPNMPLRGLGYFADLYKIQLGGSDLAESKIYSSFKISIPTPKYYVFYNGIANRPDSQDLHLSEMYDGIGDIEVTAHMLNVNYGHNKELLDRCKTLSDMSVFLHRLREYLAKGLTKEESIDRAIENCIHDHILEDILRKEQARVKNILITGLTDEQVKELHQWEIDHTREIAHFEDVEALVADGIYNVRRACDLLHVNYDDYIAFSNSAEGPHA